MPEPPGNHEDNAMIRAFQREDLHAVLQIWLDTNIRAHHFIPPKYWADHYQLVSELLPLAELYVCEDDASHKIDGFIGLTGELIAGIFVREGARSKGIGKLLLDCAKSTKMRLQLDVYQKNRRAIRFYEREQFTIESENIDKSTGEKVWIMAWQRRADPAQSN